MCMYDYGDEICTVLFNKYVKARKVHRCYECSREIRPPELYYKESITGDGDVSTHKTCVHCMKVRAWLLEECSGFIYGLIEEDFWEHAADSHYGWDVKRAAIAMKNRWTFKNGELRPLPVFKDLQ